ncbi:Alpha/Beta hydrolase protein [Xylariaceae sp. FL1019]|nr:Alpha/Beta hydrolase protein [Xylariaceae sp. FL1019]
MINTIRIQEPSTFAKTTHSILKRTQNRNMALQLWSIQPLKGARFALFFLLMPIRLMTLSVVYILVKPLRPVREWGVLQCLGRAYLKSYFHLVSVTRHQSGEQLVRPKSIGAEFLTINPHADQGFLPELFKPQNIQPTAVPALWFRGRDRPSAVKLSEEQKLVLHFPGGAFVLPIATNVVGEGVAALMAEHMAAGTLFTQYRISCSMDTRFPAAIQDIITTYHHVINAGLDPKRIILSGDSAGGNLVIAVLRYLESQDQLPLPSGAMAFSPPVHVTSHAREDYESYQNSIKDILTPSLVQWAAEAYLPKQDAAYENEARPFFSPLHHPFSTRVPLFIHTGKKEAFHASIQSFYEEMSQIPGNRIRLHESDLAPHDICLTHKLLGFTSEIGEAVRDARIFFDG